MQTNFDGMACSGLIVQRCSPDALGGAMRAGLTVALELLKDIADKYDGVSYADLFQLASATAIEACTYSVL